MSNKGFLNRLRVIIAAGSLSAFVGGWVLFAQASNASATAPTTLTAEARFAAARAVPGAPVTAHRANTARPAVTILPKLRTGGS